MLQIERLVSGFHISLCVSSEGGVWEVGEGSVGGGGGEDGEGRRSEVRR